MWNWNPVRCRMTHCRINHGDGMQCISIASNQLIRVESWASQLHFCISFVSPLFRNGIELRPIYVDFPFRSWSHRCCCSHSFTFKNYLAKTSVANCRWRSIIGWIYRRINWLQLVKLFKCYTIPVCCKCALGVGWPLNALSSNELSVYRRVNVIFINVISDSDIGRCQWQQTTFAMIETKGRKIRSSALLRADTTPDICDFCAWQISFDPIRRSWEKKQKTKSSNFIDSLWTHLIHFQNRWYRRQFMFTTRRSSCTFHLRRRQHNKCRQLCVLLGAGESTILRSCGCKWNTL